MARGPWPHVSNVKGYLPDDICCTCTVVHTNTIINSSLSYRIIDSKIRKSHETKQTNECESVKLSTPFHNIKILFFAKKIKRCFRENLMFHIIRGFATFKIILTLPKIG